MAVNDNYLNEGISFIVVSIKKNRNCHVREISKEFIEQGLIRDIKFMLFLILRSIFIPLSILHGSLEIISIR